MELTSTHLYFPPPTWSGSTEGTKIKIFHLSGANPRLMTSFLFSYLLFPLLPSPPFSSFHQQAWSPESLDWSGGSGWERDISQRLNNFQLFLSKLDSEQTTAAYFVCCLYHMWAAFKCFIFIRFILIKSIRWLRELAFSVCGKNGLKAIRISKRKSTCNQMWLKFYLYLSKNF